LDDSTADAFVSVCVGKFLAPSVSWGGQSESETCVQLNLTPRRDGSEYSADVAGVITRYVFEDGVPIPSQSERTLRVAWHGKVWTIEQIVGFRPKRDPRALR